MTIRKHLSNDNEICVIVVEECPPHLFLFCAKFHRRHEHAFPFEEGCSQFARATSAVAIRLLDLAAAGSSNLLSQRHESWCEPSRAIAVLVRICSGDNWHRNSISTASVRVVRCSKTNIFHMSCRLISSSVRF